MNRSVLPEAPGCGADSQPRLSQGVPGPEAGGVMPADAQPHGRGHDPSTTLAEGAPLAGAVSGPLGVSVTWGLWGVVSGGTG